MGLRYVCDICGKEYDAAGPTTGTGLVIPSEAPESWAMLMVRAPQGKLNPKPGLYQPYETFGYMVCSASCAEKALRDAMEYLQAAFGRVSRAEYEK